MIIGITILVEQTERGLTLNHIITGDLSPQLAANACRAIADRIDRERIRAEFQREGEPDDGNDSEG